MRKLRFCTFIRAPRQQVWQAMLHSPTYEQWTSAFCEGSTYEGSWDAGQRIRFLTPSGHGMFSEIAEHRPGEFVSIRHLGEIRNGVEDVTPAEPSSWSQAYETYTYTEADGGTQLQVDVDTPADYEQFMQDTFPKALQRLKLLCEGPPPGQQR